MPDLDFGDGSWEDARGVIQNTLSRIVAKVEGNGKEGMQDVLNGFITEYRTTVKNQEEFQDQRDKEQLARDARHERKVNLMLLVCAVLTLLIGYLTYRDSERKISSTAQNPVVSFTQPKQDAQLPSMR